MPSQYARRDESTFEVLATAPGIAGQWVMEPPTEIERFETIEFSWHGGDPGAEAPQSPLVTLERETEGGWETVLLPSYRGYTNREMRFITRVRQATDDDPWEWVIRWEELGDFPVGNYRFVVLGHFLDEAEVRQEYVLESTTLAVNPSTGGLATVDSLAANSLSGTLGLPPEERGRFSGPSSDPMVPTGVALPVDMSVGEVTVTIGEGDGAIVLTGDQIVVETNPEALGGRNGVPITRFSSDWDDELAPGTYSVRVEFTDDHGNSGVSVSEVSF
jgi:hypothetical protein